MGQQLHKYDNLLNRDVRINNFNSKWVTDGSYIRTKQGALYLPMFRALYGNSIVAYKIRHVTDSESGSGYAPYGHGTGNKESFCGVVFPQSPRLSAYFPSVFQANKRIWGNAHLCQAVENLMTMLWLKTFFSILKMEWIYRHALKLFEDARTLSDNFIHFYDRERI